MRKLKNIIICVIFVPFLWNGTKIFAQTWKPLHPLLYPANYITSLSIFNNKLLIFGNIGKIGNIILNGVNRPITWDGNVFDSIPGLCNFNGMVHSFAEFNNKLYCGGDFFQASNTCGVGNIPNTKNIARFNGTGMEAISNIVPDRDVEVLKTKNILYVAGDFWNLGNITYGCVAGYNGTNYTHLGVGVQGTNPHVTSMTEYNNEIVIGGDFYWVGGLLIYNCMAAWNGTIWHKLKDDYLLVAPCAMVVDSINNFLYVASQQPTNDTLSGMKRWDGYNWEDLHIPSPISLGIHAGYRSAPYALCMYKKELYAALFPIDTINYVDSMLWRYDGAQWHNIPRVNGTILTMCIYNDDLYIGGCFTIAGSDSAHGVACLHADTPAGCNWLIPRAFANADTVYLIGGHTLEQFYNNNAYAQSWQWNFGDTETDTVKDPLHSYTLAGIYTATVTVTEDGCTKTAQKTITVLMGNDIDTYTEESLHFIIYPNPTTGDFTVECTLPANKTGMVKAFNNYGSELGQHTLDTGCNHIIMPAGKWASQVILCGLYIDGKQVLVEKVVKISEP